jgi:hypothetical protein
MQTSRIFIIIVFAFSMALCQTKIAGNAQLKGNASFGLYVPNNWASRSTGINVAGGSSSIVRALNMDSSFTRIGTGTFGDGIQSDGSTFQDSLDTVTVADSYAGAGSLKLNVPLGALGNTSGNLHFNAKSDMSVQFGPGQEFFVQFRERIGSEYLTIGNWPTTEGFKSIIISEGDRAAGSYDAQSCSDNPDEIVLQQNVAAANQYSPWMYTGCPSGGVHPIQQAEPNFSLDFVDQIDLACAHYGGRGIPFADPNCWTYHAPEFFTFQIHVKIGTWGGNDSTVEMWAAHAGQPSQLIDSVIDWQLKNINPSTSKYGKIWLLPYQTNMSGSLVQSSIWYDDAIVSTRRIPDPDTGVPNAPDSLTLSIINTTSVDVSWRSNSSNGGPNDDTGFKIERCSGTSADCHATQNYTQVGTVGAGVTIFHNTGLTHLQQYQYRVRANNGYGNSAYAAGTCLNTATNPCGESVTP